MVPKSPLIAAQVQGADGKEECARFCFRSHGSVVSAALAAFGGKRIHLAHYDVGVSAELQHSACLHQRDSYNDLSSVCGLPQPLWARIYYRDYADFGILDESSRSGTQPSGLVPPAVRAGTAPQKQAVGDRFAVIRRYVPFPRKGTLYGNFMAG